MAVPYSSEPVTAVIQLIGVYAGPGRPSYIPRVYKTVLPRPGRVEDIEIIDARAPAICVIRQALEGGPCHSCHERVGDPATLDPAGHFEKAFTDQLHAADRAHQLESAGSKGAG